MTILKRNLCNIDGSYAIIDIGNDDVIPQSCLVAMTVDIAEHGVLDGKTWIEEHHTTFFPWFLVFLFFWCIKPKLTKIIFVELMRDDGMIVNFNFKFDTNKSIHDNIYAAPESLGIKQVWFQS